jgi:hypothetical protein
MTLEDRIRELADEFERQGMQYGRLYRPEEVAQRLRAILDSSISARSERSTTSKPEAVSRPEGRSRVGSQGDGTGPIVSTGLPADPSPREAQKMLLRIIEWAEKGYSLPLTGDVWWLADARKILGLPAERFR